MNIQTLLKSYEVRLIFGESRKDHYGNLTNWVGLTLGLRDEPIIKIEYVEKEKNIHITRVKNEFSVEEMLTGFPLLKIIEKAENKFGKEFVYIDKNSGNIDSVFKNSLYLYGVNFSEADSGNIILRKDKLLRLVGIASYLKRSDYVCSSGFLGSGISFRGKSYRFIVSFDRISLDDFELIKINNEINKLNEIYTIYDASELEEILKKYHLSELFEEVY